MKKNSLIAALFIGLLCGAWAGLAPLVNLSIWAGFASCTAYFASGKHKLPGLGITVLTNLVGVGTAWAMIQLSGLIGMAELGVGISVGAVVVLIVLMGDVPYLSFVPGIFVGCYSTFAINADYKLLIPSLVVGAILGMLCDWGAEITVNAIGDKEPVTN
ncbi:DUF1097 domain-containing protein [Actinomycetaceae bacterium TAE3-ERU4]|nr:DUF1097 domain-containing protein [Actinomycetaceae bacterium TAE3-ERU4]